LVDRLASKNDPVDRAAVAAEIRDVAEGLVSSSIQDANREGMTWRQIGAELDIPFQTLYRRYGEAE
jgi:hypothetical protein